MPRRNPISPTVAPTYCDSRLPAASTSSTAADRRVEHRRDEHDRADVRGAEDRPRDGVPQRARPARRSDTARTSRSHAALALARRGVGPIPVSRTSLPGGAVVPSTKRWRARRSRDATPSSAARSTPGRHDAVETVGTANTTSSTSQRAHRREQDDRHGEPQDPPGGREHRHVHVVEREHLVAQHAQPVEVLGPFVVLDRRHRRLQPRDVRFEEDRRPGRGSGVASRSPTTLRNHVAVGGDAESAAAAIMSTCESLSSTPPWASSSSHSASSASGNAANSDHREREHEQPRLGAVAELHHPPHRLQAAGQAGRHGRATS